MQNKIKQEEQAEIAPVKKAKGFKALLTGSFLSKDKVVEVLPFLFFMTFLGICYIANGYQAEKLIRQLFKTKNDLKEMRSEYITTKSDLMYISKQSQVAKATEELDLKELTNPPMKIVITSEQAKELRDD